MPILYEILNIMANNNNDHSQWSQLWRQGYITTFGPTMPLNYGVDVKAFWYEQFNNLNNGAVILDVAAGNGAVATIAAEYSAGFEKNFIILAADAAEINPKLASESALLNKYRSKVKFFSNAPCERLPFDDNSVDLVCSQFGIEYSELPESLPEVKRVLVDGGRFSAVMHHPESSVICDASIELDILKDALYNKKVFEKLNQLFNAIGQTTDEATLAIARQKPAVIKASQRLVKTLKYLKSQYPNSQCIDRIMGEVEGLKPYLFKPKEERKLRIKETFDDLEMTIYRQQDLQRAAISPSSMQATFDIAKSAGFKEFAYTEILTTGGDISGWMVTASK
jgi:ubiquinone/menaquinone biosynthesis C-methylase UbiE